MTIVMYVLLSVLAFAYAMIVLSIIKDKRDSRTEWERYWDEVFERNKNLNH
jgi:hypothetical protein